MEGGETKSANLYPHDLAILQESQANPLSPEKIDGMGILCQID